MRKNGFNRSQYHFLCSSRTLCMQESSPTRRSLNNSGKNPMGGRSLISIDHVERIDSDESSLRSTVGAIHHRSVVTNWVNNGVTIAGMNV